MLELNKVSITRGSKELLHHFDLELSAGNGILISGPNGIGKSSLLAAIAGDLAPNSGEIRIAKKMIQDYEPSQLAKQISIMYQKPIFSVPFLVSEFLDLLNLPADSVLFDSLGLTEKLATRLSQLSGGELQRLFFYLAIMQPANIYIFDEPISNQDEAGTMIIESAINNLVSSGKIVLLTSHTGFKEFQRIDLAHHQNSI
jgi:ABC-type cobalamin/Fe3+-siderophores transport system ATPase subunit